MDDSIVLSLKRSFTQGSNRTDLQDILFLSDQLVEVLARALSPGVNDPHTAMLCLDWLRAGLTTFARRGPARLDAGRSRVLYTRVTFERMLHRSFKNMRQYVAADRNVTIHAIGVLADLAIAAASDSMVEAALSEMRTLEASAQQLLGEQAAREEVAAAFAAALVKVERRDEMTIGEGSVRAA